MVQVGSSKIAQEVSVPATEIQLQYPQSRK